MREIKFRGKTFTNEWCYGTLATLKDWEDDNDKAIIIKSYGRFNDVSVSPLFREWYFVDKNTVGQFTGLQDSTGKDVYEGDIVLQQGYNGRKKPMVVRFECGAFIVGYHNGSSTQCRPMLLNRRCKVVGNIHDKKLEDFK